LHEVQSKKSGGVGDAPPLSKKVGDAAPPPRVPAPLHPDARNNARCTQARKTTHGLDGQRQDVDRTPRGRVSQNNHTTEIKWRKYVHDVSTVQPSDRRRLKNRTEHNVRTRNFYHTTPFASAVSAMALSVCLSICLFRRKSKFC